MTKNKFLLIFMLFFGSLVDVFAEGSSLPQLDSSKFLQEIFWLVILFGILFAFVKYVFFTKIYLIKSARNERIIMYMEKTIKIKKDVEAINKRINQSLFSAENKAKEIINNSVENVNKTYKEKVSRNLENESKKKNLLKQEINEIKNLIETDVDYDILEISKSIMEKINIKFKDDEIKSIINEGIEKKIIENRGS